MSNRLDMDGSNYDEFYNNLPVELQSTMQRLETDSLDGFTYDQLGDYLKEFELYGYTFEYYLDAEPYDFRTVDLEPLTFN